MRASFLSIILLLSTVFLSAQSPSVDSSNFGIQIGLIEALVFYEAKIADPVALRFEAGTRAFLSLPSSIRENLEVFAIPDISVELGFTIT